MSDAYQQIIETLSRCRRVLVTTHVRPDGDALGTTAALVKGLKKVGIEADALLLSHLPRKYAFLFQEQDIAHIDTEAEWPPHLAERAYHQGDPLFGRYDALVVADTGTWSQLPGLQERVANWPGPKIVLDHHQTQEEWATHKLVIVEAAAAGEIAAELLEQWEIPMDPQIASSLFVAIASDTGWFQFANTRPFTMRLAATLMEAGADTDRLYQLLYQNERPERVALQARAMQSLELLAGGRLSVMAISKADFQQTRAGVPDTENLINIPLQIRTVEVSVLLVEPIDFGPVRMSFRSKGKVDVARFAEKFGGGGHARASGAKIQGTLEAARRAVSTAMLEQLGPIPPANPDRT
jgi:bifunctional oligoribonuclease and PAP phosphatase NrnA